MPNGAISIDGLEIPFQEGDTILAAAKRAGMEIPTLCYLDGLPPATSCMICVVIDKRTGRAIPSCAARASDGMELESDTERVRSLRKGALEMLLSEHLGDCDAPCSLACPASINIPKALREFRAAPDTPPQTLSLLNFEKFPCLDCHAPCEKACRRGRYDSPVAIRYILIKVRDIFRNASDKIASTEARKKIKFQSKFGPLESDDIAVFMDSASKEPRHEPEHDKLLSAKQALAETARCMDCDCAATENCALRDLADKFDANQSTFKERRGERGRGRTFARIRGEKIVMEPGKCVLCGRCVETTRERERGLVFIGRGYGKIVSPPIGTSLDEALGDLADICVERCPTGAISFLGAVDKNTTTPRSETTT